jgi:hypothetical protein
MRKLHLFAGLVLGAVVATSAVAWGDMGHRMIGEAALAALPDTLPAFLRTKTAALEVGEYSREPDRWRGAGKVHDADRDPAHFIDLNDDGTTFAGVDLDHLPATRSDYEAAVRAKGLEPSKAGYLPYALSDAYQQVIKDMAYWRVLSYLETREKDAAKKAWFKADRLRREQLMLRDIGVLSHYVGDATQPMHLSIHYNGWGNFDNPNGFTQERIHVPLEGGYVQRNVTPSDVRAHMGDYAPCFGAPEACFATRLKRNFTQILPLYQLEKDGAFVDGNPQGKNFMAMLVGQGAADLRDVLIDAWRESKTMGVGYPARTYDDFVGNRVEDPYGLLYGNG